MGSRVTRVVGFLPVNFQFPMPFRSLLKVIKALFNGVHVVSFRCSAPHNTIMLLLIGPYYNFRRYFNKYRWFSEFALFQKVGKIAASLEHPNAKKLSASGGFAPDPRYRLALRARHEPKLLTLNSWIRPWISKYITNGKITYNALNTGNSQAFFYLLLEMGSVAPKLWKNG